MFMLSVVLFSAATKPVLSVVKVSSKPTNAFWCMDEKGWHHDPEHVCYEHIRVTVSGHDLPVLAAGGSPLSINACFEGWRG